MYNIDYIKILSFIVSFLAFFISFYKFKTEKLIVIYEKLFNEVLLESLPEAFNSFLENPSEENSAKFISIELELRKKIAFFQFYNNSIYKELINIIIEIDENFELYCNESKSEYISKISYNIRELYKIIYHLSLFKIIRNDLIFRKK